MPAKISLYDITVRILNDERLIQKRPDKEETIRPHLEKQTELILRCLKENIDNPLLKQIKTKID